MRPPMQTTDTREQGLETLIVDALTGRAPSRGQSAATREIAAQLPERAEGLEGCVEDEVADDDNSGDVAFAHLDSQEEDQ